ncbi:MAG: hypothetical protein ACJ76Z_04025 [Thermoleophilaceae bacterium]
MALWVHHCPWCGWSRDAESATMLSPRCENCGGLLEAVPAEHAPRAGEGLTRIPAAPRLGPSFGRVARFVMVGLLLFAAARFGWNAGGLGLALAAAGVVGLFTVPLIVGE